jgi:hypothetical protein
LRVAIEGVQRHMRVVIVMRALPVVKDIGVLIKTRKSADCADL